MKFLFMRHFLKMNGINGNRLLHLQFTIMVNCRTFTSAGTGHLTTNFIEKSVNVPDYSGQLAL